MCPKIHRLEVPILQALAVLWGSAVTHERGISDDNASAFPSSCGKANPNEWKNREERSESISSVHRPLISLVNSVVNRANWFHTSADTRYYG